MKTHPHLKLLMLTFSILLTSSIFAQVNITGVSDSTAVVGDPFVSQVIATGSPTTYTLLEKPHIDMNISASGIISWTPGTITDGGKVTVQASDGGSTDEFSFNVYIAGSVTCPDNLVAYYPLDEFSAPYEEALYGIDNPTVLTPVTAAPGKVGNAQTFTPTGLGSQFLSIADNDQWDFSMPKEIHGFSFSVWVNSAGVPAISGAGNQVLFASYENVIQSNGQPKLDKQLMIGLWNDPDDGLDVLKPNMKLRFDSTSWVEKHDPLDEDTWELHETGREVIHTNNLPEDEWVHLVFVYDMYKPNSSYGRIGIYMNGTSVTMLDVVYFYLPESFNADDIYSMGFYNFPDYSDPFNGMMDEFCIYDKPLSSTEVNQLYLNGMDGIGACAPDNHAPLFTNELLATATEDAFYSSNSLSNDIDGDGITLSVISKPDWIDVNTSTKIVSGTPTNADVGTNTITLQITDGSIPVSKTFTIEVDNTNDPPVIDSSPAETTDEDVLYEYVIEFTDVDDGDVVTVTADAPTWLTLSANTLSGTPTQALLGINEYVDFPIEITVTDEDLATDVQSYTLRVNNVNDAPQFLPDLPQNTLTTPANTALTLNPGIVWAAEHIIDEDNVFPNDFSLTVQAGTGYTWSTNGTDVMVTPNEGVRGTITVNVILSDGEADAPTTINISVANSAPVIASTPITSAAVGVPYSYTLTATDDDPDDVLSFSATFKPDWVDFDPATQELSGTPTGDDVDEAGDVQLVVSDGFDEDVQNFIITISLTAVPEYNSSSLLIYPLPAQDKLYVEFTDPIGTSANFELLDLSGNRIMQRTISSESTLEVFDVSELNPGMYIYRITEDDQNLTGKILIK